MLWAGMCFFQLDESMCPCQESFTFPFFLGCCFQPWHCISLLYLFLGVADSSFGTYCISVFVSLPLSDIIQVRSGWEKNKDSWGYLKYKSKNKSMYSKRNDRQLASSEQDHSPGVLPLFSMRSELGIWLQ